MADFMRSNIFNLINSNSNSKGEYFDIFVMMEVIENIMMTCSGNFVMQWV